MKNYKVSFSGAKVSSSSSPHTRSKIVSAKSADDAKDKIKSQYHTINIIGVEKV